MYNVLHVCVMLGILPHFLKKYHVKAEELPITCKQMVSVLIIIPRGPADNLTLKLIMNKFMLGQVHYTSST